MSEPPKPAAAPAAPPPPPKILGSERNSAVMWDRIRKRPKPLISVAFTVPVFLAYHLNLLWLDRRGPDRTPRSGFDIPSTALRRAIAGYEPAYVLTTLALALAVLVTTWVHQKRGKIPESPHKRVLWESFGAAVVAVLGLSYVTHQVLRGETNFNTSLPWGDRVVLALGSGFYQELLFRALLVRGTSQLLGRVTKLRNAWLVLGLSMLTSSVLFSLSHFFAVYDKPFNWSVAVYLVSEALFFATLFVARGFGVAVYTHTFYNLFTLLWWF